MEGWDKKKVARQKVEMGNARKKWTGETKNGGVRQKAEGPNWPVGYLYFWGGGGEKIIHYF